MKQSKYVKRKPPTFVSRGIVESPSDSPPMKQYAFGIFMDDWREPQNTHAIRIPHTEWRVVRRVYLFNDMIEDLFEEYHSQGKEIDFCISLDYNLSRTEHPAVTGKECLFTVIYLLETQYSNLKVDLFFHSSDHLYREEMMTMWKDFLSTHK